MLWFSFSIVTRLLQLDSQDKTLCSDHRKEFQSYLCLSLCEWQSTWRDLNCPHTLILNHLVQWAGSELRLPSELPSLQWQPRHRGSGPESGPCCSRPGGHTGRARWPGDREAETGRCPLGCLDVTDERGQHSEHGQVIAVRRELVLVTQVQQHFIAVVSWCGQTITHRTGLQSNVECLHKLVCLLCI